MEDENSEQKLRDEFSERVKSVTVEELPAFIADIMGRNHDYGSVCVALGMAAAATAWACNKHEGACGGVTGFQSGAIAWEFLRHWGALYPKGECGGRFVDFNDLLFPQYGDKFTSISASTWEAVQAEARKRLREADGGKMISSSVYEHWISVSNGVVPFGLRIAA